MSPRYLPGGTGTGFTSFPEQSFSGGTCHASGLSLLWHGQGKKVEKYFDSCLTAGRAEVLWWGKNEESPFWTFEAVIVLAFVSLHATGKLQESSAHEATHSQGLEVGIHVP